MELSNETLLEDLHRFARDELGLFHTVDVQHNLTGGIADTAAMAVAVHSDKGIPVIVFDASYRQWPQDDLIAVYCHECAHHLLHHVDSRTRVTSKAQPGTITRAVALLYERNERAADEAAKGYAKRFRKWREDQLLADLQAQVDEIFVMLGKTPRRVTK